MNKNPVYETKLTTLQENILLELDKTMNFPFIYKKLNIKPITLTKIISLLVEKNLISDNQLSDAGKKMVHYITFKNETISSFLNKYKIAPSDEIINQMNSLDHKIIIALRNLL